MNTIKRLMCLLLLCALLPAARAEEGGWVVGFAARDLTYGPMDEYHIAGYRNGVSPTGVLDPQRVSALWLQAGGTSALLVVVDCVGLSGGMVGEIRDRLAAFRAETGCGAVHVIATHTHAGVDTLGLWGPVGVDGRNGTFQEQIPMLAEEAARAAWQDRKNGELLYSVTPTTGLQRDSRAPQVYDPNLYQLRFVPQDGGRGVRILNYAAHAEALRGANRLISRDYPGAMADIILRETGDETLYLPGAVGGLIMTKEFTLLGAEENLRITGEKLAAHALAPAAERSLPARLGLSTVAFTTPLENTLFIWYKFLGVLDSRVSGGPGSYTLTTELSLIRLGDLTAALLPGEIFPELISGTGHPKDPQPLREIAAECGADELLIIGLANDEIGYILPPSAFAVDENYPYVQSAPGHYEETNSVGPRCALDLAEAFRQAFNQLEME